MLAGLDTPEIVTIALASGLLLGALFLWLLTRKDHHTWVLARAPQLPVRSLAVGDDAWLRGAVRSDAPLRCPWFDVDCVAYDYRIERKVTRTRRDSKGRTRTETSWTTDHHEDRSSDFTLDDGPPPAGAAIVVRMQGADNEALRDLDTDYETTSRRHSAAILELGAEVSVLGVKGDDGSFRGEREVPLLLTRLPRADRLRASHRSEAVLFFFACALPFVGGACAVAIPNGAMWYQTVGNVVTMLAAGLGTAAPMWLLGTYNRFVRLRQQVLAAFRQVDVDLAVRSGLVPNLVAVVKGAADHERDLLAGLTQLRAGATPEQATATERGAAAVARRVLLLHERYPELTTDAVYRDLHERLWAVEEKLAHSRQLYNDVVTEWNDRTARFPAALLARLCGHRQAPLFAGDDAAVPPPLRDRDLPPAGA